ncbi:MAG: hypothetical protein JXA67_19185 [Micromonosporaceae bacterium]|nr:hypothetical protein [Micromonosporaceae bacterium]
MGGFPASAHSGLSGVWWLRGDRSGPFVVGDESGGVLARLHHRRAGVARRMASARSWMSDSSIVVRCSAVSCPSARTEGGHRRFDGQGGQRADVPGAPCAAGGVLAARPDPVGRLGAAGPDVRDGLPQGDADDGLRGLADQDQAR